MKDCFKHYESFVQWIQFFPTNSYDSNCFLNMKSHMRVIIFNLSRTQFTTQKIENGYDIAVTLASPKNSTLALDIWFSRQNQPKKKKNISK